jgi:glucosamine kinase
MSAPVLIAVDGGQSSTTCLVGDTDGRPLAWRVGGPIWHIGEPGGQERVRAAIADPIRAALDAVGRRPSDVRRAYLALTGSSAAAARIAAELLPGARVESVSDAYAALASGTFGEPGLVVVSGTGSVAMSLDDRGRVVHRGGWGPLLGDDGSAYRIGLDALRAFTRAADGYPPPTLLLTAVAKALSLDEPRQLFDAAYDGTLDRIAIARLAPLVADAAAQGDTVAEGIVRAAAEALARLVEVTAHASELRGSDRRVVLSGGVLLAGGLVAARLSSRLGEILPDYPVIRPAVQPVVGAFALALRSYVPAAAGAVSERLARATWPAELCVRTDQNRNEG